MKNTYKQTFVVLLILFLGSFDAVLAKDGYVPQQAHDLVQEFFDAGDSPGLAVSVGLGGRIIWSEGFGYADVEQKVEVDPARTLFRIGSVIKPMTAYAVAQLVQADRLDLDAPVQAYVPDFPQKIGTITTRQLLSHLSGIRHYEGDEFFNHTPFRSVTAGLAVFKDDPLLHPPGERYRYSSYGYNLVSAVIEGATGEQYLDYMADHVFGPLGMQDTRPDYLARIIPGRGRYYTRDNGVLVNAPEVDNSYKWASGGYVGTVDDLVRFGLAQMHDEPVNAMVRRVFWVEQVTSAGEKTGYGLGWIIRTDESGQQWIGHGGGSVGGTTQFWINPHSGLVIAMISNLSDFKYEKIVPALGAVFLARSEPPAQTIERGVSGDQGL